LDSLRRRAPGTNPRSPDRAGRTRSSRASSAADSRIRFLLFADVQNFSKMSEESVRPFVTYGLGLVARLAREPALRPIGREPRGDGAYLVFDTADAAGSFALRLTDAVRETKWSLFGLPEDMIMRIALHAGPVLRIRDPVSRSVLHIGTHVN